MALSSSPIIVLSSDSEDERQPQPAAAKRVRRASPDAPPPAARPSPPPAAARKTKAPSPPPTAPSLLFDRVDPLFSCGFALTAVPNLQTEPGFADCNSSADRGARLSDVVTGKPRNALVSNFMIDPVWLFNEFPALRQVPGHLAVATGDDRMVAATQQALEVFALRGCLSKTVTRPPTEKFGTHHSKFFVLEYGWGVTVVVVTGNFIPNEYESKTQALWFQKFPWKDAESPISSDFEECLFDYIQKLGIRKESPGAEAALLGAVRRCDFDSARADLVTSVPGNWKGNDYRRYATGRLQHLLSRSKGFSDSLVVGGGGGGTGGASQLVAQCSSLGKLQEPWLASWASAASGGTSRRGAPLGNASAGGDVSIVWPTADDIKNSVEGWTGGGCVPGSEATLSLPSITRRLCRWSGNGGPSGPGTPKRSRAVPHCKIYCRLDPVSGALAWCLVGSANFSVAAWGSSTKGGDSSYIRSWEFGVLLTPGREAAYRRHRHRGFNGGCVSSGGGGTAAAAALAAAASDATPFPRGSLLLAAGRAPGARVGPLPEEGANFVDFYAAGRAPGQKATAAAAASEEEAGGPSSSSATKVEVVQLPIPFALPPQRYRPGQDDPWVVDKLFPGTDSHGRFRAAL